jgi:enamine deaminase RidA (YjgF/YER057c/UK114 family)
VLMRRNINADPDDIFDEHFAGDPDNCGRVEQAVLSHTDFDDQCDAALAEIEAILTEVGVMAN